MGSHGMLIIPFSVDATKAQSMSSLGYCKKEITIIRTLNHFHSIYRNYIVKQWSKVVPDFIKLASFPVLPRSTCVYTHSM